METVLWSLCFTEMMSSPKDWSNNEIFQRFLNKHTRSYDSHLTFSIRFLYDIIHMIYSVSYSLASRIDLARGSKSEVVLTCRSIRFDMQYCRMCAAWRKKFERKLLEVKHTLAYSRWSPPEICNFLTIFYSDLEMVRRLYRIVCNTTINTGRFELPHFPNQASGHNPALCGLPTVQQSATAQG